MSRVRVTTDAQAKTAVNEIFGTADHQKGRGRRLKEVGEERAEARKTGEAGPSKSGFAVEDLPLMNQPWLKIQERIFRLDDPNAEYEHLAQALKVTDALTPGNLQLALNEAEENAVRAHKLYIIAKVEYERFELEMARVTEAMREAANADLQREKEQKQRTKAITEVDVRGRALVLFPDEWSASERRQIEAKAMMDHLRVFAERWASRCFSISNMLNSGRRI